MANFAKHNFSAAALDELRPTEKLIDKYGEHAEIYKKDGISLRDYVSCCFHDEGRELSAVLDEALTTLQQNYGAVHDPANFLSRDL